MNQPIQSVHFFHLQVPSGKQASVFVDASKFNVHTRSAKGRCPFDFMRIKGIDESLAPAAFNATTNSVRFPGDAGHFHNEVKLCGNLLNDVPNASQNYTAIPDRQIVIDFVADESIRLKGFRADICVAA